MVHPWLGRLVRDVASGAEGLLMAVVVEEVATHDGQRWTRRAYIRPEGGGRGLPTAVGNIQPLTDEALPRFTTDLDRLTPEQRRRFRQTVAAFVDDLCTGRFATVAAFCAATDGEPRWVAGAP
ncbi:hypothetical protein ACF087_30965 [Streptomyces goshikiensis]|uniref:hypothetical protein n=1 Tax=Streptomyces goshikiensis TaxID=1942 RepID=UPI0036F60DC2